MPCLPVPESHAPRRRDALRQRWLRLLRDTASGARRAAMVALAIMIAGFSHATALAESPAPPPVATTSEPTTSTPLIDPTQPAPAIQSALAPPAAPERHAANRATADRNASAATAASTSTSTATTAASTATVAPTWPAIRLAGRLTVGDQHAIILHLDGHYIVMRQGETAAVALAGGRTFSLTLRRLAPDHVELHGPTADMALTLY